MTEKNIRNREMISIFIYNPHADNENERTDIINTNADSLLRTLIYINGDQTRTRRREFDSRYNVSLKNSLSRTGDGM